MSDGEGQKIGSIVRASEMRRYFLRIHNGLLIKEEGGAESNYPPTKGWVINLNCYCRG